MESGMMKIVFSSINNGTSRDMSANETSRHDVELNTNHNDCFMPKIRFSQPKAQSDDFKEKSAQEVFSSLVNASNCANLRVDNALEGYLTFTPEGAFLRKYL